MVRSWEAEFAGCGGDEEAPLVPGERAYTNPYVDQEDLDAAMNDDNVSVLSGGDLDQEKTDATLKKSSGKGATVAEVKKAAGEVLAKKPEAEDSQPWWLPLLVVVIFITFDAGKPIAERVASHGTTINTGFLNLTIQLANIAVASTLCCVFMGPSVALTSMFEWNKLKLYALPSSMFSISQLLNLVQNIYLDSSSRKVFSQLRIPLTALFSTFITGSGYSVLQWMMIASLTCSVFQFQLMGSTSSLFANPSVVIGLGFSILTNIFAVLGSLLGEKNMKESKKLPFYLQKFQFDFWTAIFGLFGTFVLVPAMAIGIDMAQLKAGEQTPIRQRAQFKKNWPIMYKTAYYVYKPSLTNWEYEAEYTLKSGSEPEKFVLSNKMDTAFWSQSVDLRGDGQMVFGKTIGEENSENNLSGTFQLIENHAKIALKRRHVPKDANLGDFEARENFVDKAIMKPVGKIGKHHESSYRAVAGYMLDTKFYTAMPFDMATENSDESELKENFVLAIGNHNNKNQFEELSMMRRDQPELQTVKLKKKGDIFDAGLTKDGAVDMGTPYFTLTMTPEQAFGDANLKPVVDALAQKMSKYDEKQGEEYRKENGKPEKLQTSVRVSFARAVKYTPAEKKLMIQVARKTAVVAEYISEEKKDKVVKADDSKIEVQTLELVCDKDLHFDGVYAGKDDASCKLESDMQTKETKTPEKKDDIWNMVSIKDDADFLAENDRTKFKQNQQQLAKDLKKDKTFNVQTYPGKAAAGIATKAGTGCTREMCRISAKQWDNSFGYLGGHSAKTMAPIEAPAGKEKVFATAEFHGYTWNPLPWDFINRVFILAVFFNAGQGWMSAYIAKVLSSLWKNICAAVALIVIVLIERLFMDDVLAQKTTDWTRILFGTAGVLMTVLVFQMSPKEKKH